MDAIQSKNVQCPLISVIVPIYNTSHRMDDCIRCLLEQAYSNLEIFLIDDGSTDDSWERIQYWANRDSRIRPFHKENGGVSSARNYGLDRMKGTFCTFVDSDDAFSIHMIEWLYEAICVGETTLSTCGILVRNENNFYDFPLEQGTHEKIRKISTIGYNQWADYAHVQCYGALYASELLQDIRFDETISYAEDVLFFTQAFLKAGATSYVQDRLYYYIEWSDSALHSCYNERQFSDVTVWEQICETVKTVDALWYKSSMTKYMFSCTRAFYYSLTSKTDCKSIRKDAVQRLRRNWKTVLQMPPQCKKEKIKALIAMCSPALGEKIWMQIKNKGLERNS